MDSGRMIRAIAVGVIAMAQFAGLPLSRAEASGNVNLAGNPSSAIVVNGEPEVFYGGASLTEAYYDGFSWHATTLDTPTPKQGFTPAIDAVAATVVSGDPVVFYADQTTDQVRELTWHNGTWTKSVIDGQGCTFVVARC